jgi:hypothetical protein
MKQAKKVAAQIAREHLGVQTLEDRKSDALDFHNLSVWRIEAALVAAYYAGIESKRKPVSAPAAEIAQAVIAHMEMSVLCIHCGNPVHRATMAEMDSALLEGEERVNQWKHDDGGWLCKNIKYQHFAQGPDAPPPDQLDNYVTPLTAPAYRVEGGNLIATTPLSAIAALLDMALMAAEVSGSASEEA